MNRRLSFRSFRSYLAAGFGVVALLIGGCATNPPPKKDLTAFQAAKPASILILPPVNESPDVLALPGVLSQLAWPLAESGYYVPSVALVEETLKANGVQTPAEAHAIEPSKLREIFGTDAVLYTTVKRYGSTYRLLSSDAVVELRAQIRDLRNNELLWEGRATASSAEQQGQTQGGLAGLLIRAVVDQIVGTLTDRSHPVAGIASLRMLKTGFPEGVPPGPRARAMPSPR